MPAKKQEVLIQDKPSQPVSVVNEPTRLIELAITQNADIEKLERLMELQERYNRTNAQKAFNAALSRFQSDCPAITKRKQGHNYKYAPLSDIVAQVKTALTDHGLSYRFEQDHANGITVTCIVSHLDGHSERTTMTAMPDGSGSKNAVQAIGSTVQYLMRYTFIGALGITTADEDMDGRLPAQEAPAISHYYPSDQFDTNFSQWQKAISSGKRTPEQIIGMVESKAPLTDAQKQQIHAVKGQ